MITLYTFGPFFGLPDGSPFVTKAMLLLKMANVPYQEDRTGYAKAPKGKLPYIKDEGKIIADSTLLRFYIEDKYNVDFDAALNAEQQAISWAVEKMCEEHLYFAILYERWMIDANFAVGPSQFFKDVPAIIRPLIKRLARRQMINAVKAQGMGRHSYQEVTQLVSRDLAAMSIILADKPYLMGDKPCAADATLYAFVAGVLAPIFASPIREQAEKYSNLVAYCERMKKQYF